MYFLLNLRAREARDMLICGQRKTAWQVMPSGMSGIKSTGALFYFLSREGIYLLSSEEVDLTVMEDLTSLSQALP